MYLFFSYFRLYLFDPKSSHLSHNTASPSFYTRSFFSSCNNCINLNKLLMIPNVHFVFCLYFSFLCFWSFTFANPTLQKFANGFVVPHDDYCAVKDKNGQINKISQLEISLVHLLSLSTVLHILYTASLHHERSMWFIVFIMLHRVLKLNTHINAVIWNKH